ncbi:hypothetical protein [Alloalcanivorax profundimaris]|uniref:hypothetical protein n=1 Tax=Alloalcanivorax profundimaris TaxID=2735259 RepID=UPI0018887BD3|nr:hypothetical protein [Alloalcanivorax profundimaris]MBF1802358.1 hypothetical protein [Alloalcanivorax profundimaris]MCQ6260879.1 hypothetical protein [Alcanivorax sp. MM125-6]
MVEEVVSGHREYYIRALVRGYVTTLLNMGFSQRYIREQSQNMFYAFGSNVSSNENIRQFVDVFSHERHDFFVAYRAPDYFEGFSEAAKKIGIDVCKNISGKQTILSRFGFSVRKGGVYLYIDSIIGEDPYTIKSAADRKVDLLQTLIGLYHHKEHPKTILEAVVYNKTLGRGKKINKSKNPMHKCRDLTKEKAAKKLDEFMAGFSMKRDSFQKFNRSAELHALALASDSSENQMINLWIALESLIPSKGEANDKSNIEHVVDSIVPFINLEYICSLVLSFVRDMWRWDSRNFKNALKGISGSDVLSKTVKILALDEFNESKDIIRESCRGYVWLGLRFEYILTIFHSPKSVSDALEAHKVRVGWQIRRIYRARNMMVHEGITPTYIDVLIEHAHDYLDCVMNGVMRLASKANTLNAIDQAFKMAEINYKSYRDGLRVKNENFSQENIEQKIFEKIIR